MNCQIIFTQDYKYIAAIHDMLYEFNLKRTGCERSAVQAKDLPESAALIICDETGKCYGGMAYHWENSPRHIFGDYFLLTMHCAIRAGDIK